MFWRLTRDWVPPYRPSHRLDLSREPWLLSTSPSTPSLLPPCTSSSQIQHASIIALPPPPCSVCCSTHQISHVTHSVDASTSAHATHLFDERDERFFLICKSPAPPWSPRPLYPFMCTPPGHRTTEQPPPLPCPTLTVSPQIIPIPHRPRTISCSSAVLCA